MTLNPFESQEEDGQTICENTSRYFFRGNLQRPFLETSKDGVAHLTKKIALQVAYVSHQKGTGESAHVSVSLSLFIGSTIVEQRNSASQVHLQRINTSSRLPSTTKTTDESLS